MLKFGSIARIRAAHYQSIARQWSRLPDPEAAGLTAFVCQEGETLPPRTAPLVRLSEIRIRQIAQVMQACHETPEIQQLFNMIKNEEKYYV